MTADVILFSARQMGRYATRVRVRDGAFAGMAGVIVTIHHDPGSIAVRFTTGRLAGQTLPFGRSELEVIR